MQLSSISSPWVIRRTAALLFALWLISAWSTVRAQAEEGILVDRIVAQVNDDIITLYDLNRHAAPFLKRVKAMARPIDEERRMIYELREKVLNQMIDETLTDQEIRRYNIQVSEEAIDNTIEEMKKRAYMTDQQLRDSLQKEGLTMTEYRERMKNQILRIRLVNREVKSKIVITDEDIRAYYNENKAKYVGEGSVHLRQIMVNIPSEADEEGKQAIRDKLSLIRQQVMAGASFEAMAREHTESPIANDGGDLGTFAMNELSPQILDALTGLKAGDVTGVLENERSMQIYYVQTMTVGGSKSLEDVSSEIENILYEEIVNLKFMSWLNELRERSHIKIVR